MKNVKRVAQLAAVLTLGLGASVGWGASLVTYSLATTGPGQSTVSALSSDPGLVLQTALAIPGSVETPNTFSLNDGDSKTFDFFDIWTNETDINLDDLAAVPITATMNFVLPVNTGVVIDGETRGELVVKGTLKSGGVVTWDGPGTYDVGGLSFTVTLSNETFNLGRLLNLGTILPGEVYGATVEATVQQISSLNLGAGPTPSAVPTPEAGVAGMGLMAGMGVWKRMRRSK